MNCKYCNRTLYFGVISGKRHYFNTDDKKLHHCQEYLDQLATWKTINAQKAADGYVSRKERKTLKDGV